jgi:CysZ protein
VNDFIYGFNSFFRGFAFSISRGMLKWYLVPLALWLFLMVYLTFSLSDFVLPYVNQWLNTIPGFEETPTDKSFWATARNLLLTGMSLGVALAIKILIWYVLGRYMKYIIQILLSPLLAWLSERTEEITSGRTFPFNAAQFAKDVIRGIGITLRNMFLETLLLGVGLLFSFFIPVLAPVITVFLFGINCYFMGFNFFDYVAERHKLSIAEGVKFMRSNRNTLLGFGLAYNLTSVVPLLDWLVAPISGAVGASLAGTAMMEKSGNSIVIMQQPIK